MKYHNLKLDAGTVGAALVSVALATSLPGLATGENRCAHKGYHTNGSVSLEECREDRNNDGFGEHVTKTVYNSAGQRTKFVVDANDDTSPELIIEWKYDCLGNKIERTIDRDGNGFPEERMNWAYDVAGRKVKRTVDRNGDYIPDQTWTWEYDLRGKVVGRDRDNDGDGLFEIVWRTRDGWNQENFYASKRNRPPPVTDGWDARFARGGSFGVLRNKVSGMPKALLLSVPEFSPETGGVRSFTPPVLDLVENSVHSR